MVRPEDFAEIVREHQAMVFSIALHYLHDRDLAEELAQEVFLQLYRNLRGLKSPEHVKYWLRKVTTHRSIDYGRHRGNRPRLSLEDAPEPVVATPSGDVLLSDKLRQLVASLPEKQRMVVILRYQEELEPEEISRVLGIPVGTVKSQLQRSLAVLRDKVIRTLGAIHV